MTILEHPNVRSGLYPISVPFYHEAGRLGLIGEDVELLDGSLFLKMPKSPLHQTLIRRCLRLLLGAVPDGCFIAREDPLTLAASEPEPDLSVIRGTEEDFTTHHPTSAELIIEVAVSTIERDLAKATIYADAGIKEYWIIEPELKQLRCFSEPKAGGYDRCTVVSGDSEARSCCVPQLRISAAELFQI
jgi:Uma2 family endonuclease